MNRYDQNSTNFCLIIYFLINNISYITFYLTGIYVPFYNKYFKNAQERNEDLDENEQFLLNTNQVSVYFIFERH